MGQDLWRHDVPLKLLFTFRSGTSRPSLVSSGNIPVMGASGRIGFSSVSNSSGSALLIGRVGTVGNVTACEPPFWASDNVIVATPKPGLDFRFAYYCLLAQQLHTHASETAQPLLTASSIGELRIDLPPEPEQSRIADFLEAEVPALRRASDLATRQMQLVDERETCLLQEAIAVSDAPYVPIKRMVSRLTSGPRGWGTMLAEAGTPFIRITNIPRRGIDLDLSNLAYVNVPASAERERTRTRSGDVLVSITADIGSVGIVEELGVDGNVSQHVALLRPVVEKCLPRWLAYAIKAPTTNASLTMTSYGGTKVGLGLSDVAETLIPVPSLADQEARVQRVDEAMRWADSMRVALTRRRGLFAERQRALIADAVAGRFDVTTAREVEA
ncbi:restriction endonuclease subunit S [Micromonospora chalcea]